MTIINPNSISGISSITALNSTAAINLFKADGTSANVIAGVTTGANFITGTSNVHSTGYECTNINASGIVTAASLDISGDIDFDGHTELDNGNVSGVVTFTNSPNAIQMNDDARVSFGTSLKTAILYNTSDSKTKITNFNNTLQIGYRNTEIYHTNQARLTFDSGNTFSNVVNTSFSGANYHVVWIPSSDTFRFNDNAKLTLGTGNDLQLYWTGSAGFITNQGGGNLHFNSDTVLIKNAANTKSHIRAYANSSVEIFHNNSITKQRWYIVTPSSKRCYMGPFSPSESLEEYHPNIPDDVKFKNPTEQESSVGYNNFVIIRCHFYEIDFLKLKYSGHQRCKFIFDKEKINANWLAP